MNNNSKKPFNRYSPEMLEKLRGGINEVDKIFTHYFNSRFSNIYIANLSNKSAKNYYTQGVLRRLEVMHRCIKNIYTIYPPENTIIGTDKKIDLVINIHTFYINAIGIVDCISKMYLNESNNIDDKMYNIFDIFKPKRYQKKSSIYTTESLKSRIESSNHWYKNISDKVRNDIAHRIPSYVPDAYNHKDLDQLYKLQIRLMTESLNSEERLSILGKIDRIESENKFTSKFIQSDGFDDNRVMFPFHVQIIADFRTVDVIIKSIFDEIKA